MPEHEEHPSQDHADEIIDVSAWKMWRMVLKTCGPWTALRTGAKYLLMRAKGEV